MTWLRIPATAYAQTLAVIASDNMTKYFAIISILIFISCQRTKKDSHFLGEDYARKALAEAKADSLDILPVDKTLIDNEETAVKFAEVILFKVYGQETIVDEKPYEVHNIDGYWIINGTIPKGSLGGAFEIIFNSSDGRVIRLVHYK